ncbi:MULTISPECIES: hypothetical protein [Corallococcus]|uniref:hypothetical protein n=1 Tax=Corallococcus TaxID=83461 RepID=UPI0011811912|nr:MULTISPECIES: hypothetical protein [Corallococcus]NBD10151.1 hypothetical protein [Corallococcus silvisoli]TSC27384.1 hypothetical protein FOF48_18240 [Corallococcus sp. Z5C101001]
MRRLRGAAGLLLMGLAGGGVLSACHGGDSKPEGPSASHREGRSEVLRGLMASKQNVDPAALKAAGAQAKNAGAPTQPEPPGTGGSGRPETQEWAAGKVSWVGDDEVLFVDGQGQEREVRVDQNTRLRRNDDNAQLRDLMEGDELRVTYDDTREGWIARDVDVVSVPRPPPPNPESPPLR